jgi:hypothetical protein
MILSEGTVFAVLLNVNVHGYASPGYPHVCLPFFSADNPKERVG